MHTDFLCFKEPIQDIGKTEMEVCILLSLFLLLFASAHTHSHGEQAGIFEFFENIRQCFFRPGRYKWIAYLIQNCIQCLTRKTKRHDLHGAPLEQ